MTAAETSTVTRRGNQIRRRGGAREHPPAPLGNWIMGSAIVGKRLVLVVEDQAFIRMNAADIVTDAGFEAIEACGADEALPLLGSRDDIWTIFTDINMPGSMDGLKLCHVVRERWPWIKFIVTSGVATLAAHDLPSGGCFIKKPYTPSQIVSVLNDFALIG
jgi:CheY-like chemotaxis protein